MPGLVYIYTGKGERGNGRTEFTYRMLYSLKSAWTRWQCWYILRVAMISSAYRSGNLSSGISASFKRGDALIFHNPISLLLFFISFHIQRKNLHLALPQEIHDEHILLTLMDYRRTHTSLNQTSQVSQLFLSPYTNHLSRISRGSVFAPETLFAYNVVLSRTEDEDGSSVDFDSAAWGRIVDVCLLESDYYFF